MNFTIYEPVSGDLVSYTLLESKINKNCETRILIVIDPADDKVLDETGTPIVVNLRFTSTNPWIRDIKVVRAGATIVDYVNDGNPSRGLIPRERNE